VKLAPLAQAGVVPSINQEIVGRQLVPAVEPEEQRQIGALCAALDEESSRCLRLREQAQRLRSGLVNALLSGAQRIPASYDRFLRDERSSNEPQPLAV
jgi:hypothetical protein